MKTKITVITKYFQKNDYINNINMLYFNRIDVSKIVDINERSASKECDICDYWYFWMKGLSFNWMSAMGVMMY